jgi:hypothetical protein
MSKRSLAERLEATVEIGLDYTRVHFSDGISADLYGEADPRVLAKRAQVIAEQCADELSWIIREK